MYELLHKAFTRVWKLKFSNIGALALVLYDLARYHSEFAVGVVDQVLENIRGGLEVRPQPKLLARDHIKLTLSACFPDQHLQAQPETNFHH